MYLFLSHITSLFTRIYTNNLIACQRMIPTENYLVNIHVTRISNALRMYLISGIYGYFKQQENSVFLVPRHQNISYSGVESNYQATY